MIWSIIALVFILLLIGALIFFHSEEEFTMKEFISMVLIGMFFLVTLFNIVKTKEEVIPIIDTYLYKSKGIFYVFTKEKVIQFDNYKDIIILSDTLPYELIKTTTYNIYTKYDSSYTIKLKNERK